MYITVHTKILNKDILFRSPRLKKLRYMTEEGWKLTDKNRGIFYTTYSFSKII